MLPITFLCRNITIFHSVGLSIYYLHPPPTKDDCDPYPQIFVCAVLIMKSERFIYCRYLWKICMKGPNFVVFLEEKTRIPLHENLPFWGWGGTDKNRTSDCLILSKGTLIFTFDHQVFLRSAKLCPTPPAASPHNSWAMLRLHKSNLMISPAKNKPGR